MVWMKDFRKQFVHWVGGGFEVWMAQVLDDGEIEPDLEGDLRLIDSENDQIAEITVNRDNPPRLQNQPSDPH